MEVIGFEKKQIFLGISSGWLENLQLSKKLLKVYSVCGAIKFTLFLTGNLKNGSNA